MERSRRGGGAGDRSGGGGGGLLIHLRHLDRTRVGRLDTGRRIDHGWKRTRHRHEPAAAANRHRGRSHGDRSGRGTPNSAAPAPLLAQAGYVEEELLLAGDATAYTPDGTWGPDGEWAATPAGSAPYITRALVRRPTDPAAFNGTVLVEWLNVSAGSDVAVDFGYLNQELLDQGYIYVGVSAQRVGHQAAKESDPARYETMVHPGDEYSYDIFTQAGSAVIANALFDDEFVVQKVIADGESQSAGRMVTYINAIAPLVDVYDGFLVHSRGDRMTPIAAGQEPVTGARIRTDQGELTLVVLTETDVLNNAASQQPDSESYRRWEIAGTAHVDNYDLAVLSGEDPTEPAALGSICEKPINDAHQHWVMNAGLRHLDGWIRGGDAPPEADRMAIGPDDLYVVDVHGNATGGLRIADVDVPISTLTGLGNSPSWCRLYGTSTPFDAATLDGLYPSRDTYADAYLAAVGDMVDAGFMLERDVAEAEVFVASAPVGT